MKIKSFGLLLAGLLLWAVTVAGFGQKTFTSEDMLAVVGFARGSAPIISPSGKFVAYTAVDVSRESNIRAFWPTGFLHIASVDSGASERLGSADDYGAAPAWSPVGEFLAYVRTRRGVSRIVVRNVSNKTEKVLEIELPGWRKPGRFSRPAPIWTPDGKSLLVPVLERVPEQVEPRVRVVKGSDPVLPGDARFTDSRKWNLVAVDVASGESRELTSRAEAIRGFAIAPNGRWVLYRAITPETLGHFRREKSVWRVIPFSGSSEPRTILAGRPVNWVVFGPGGSSVLFPEKGRLLALDLDGGRERVVASEFPQRTRSAQVSKKGWIAFLAARPGTGPQNSRIYSILKPVYDAVALNLQNGRRRVLTSEQREDEIEDLTWSADGESLYFHSVDPVAYRESLHRWKIQESEAHVFYSADEALGNLSLSQNGERASFTSMDSIRPRDDFVYDFKTETKRQLTKLNPQLENFRFVRPQTFSFYSADGDPLKALLFKPSGSADRPLPVITYVYEKLTPSRNRFNAEAQFYVSHGYAFLMPDVLVKVGYTGDSFVKCVVPAVNVVRAQGFTNGHFGITGGSFGGYAGLFLISHVDIFSAAVLRAPPSEFFSTWGDGRDRDVWTIETGQARTGGSPFEVPELYLENSPFFSASRVHTPLLILHGKKDFTVPFQQGEMMFDALRALKRPVELVIYREGDHSVVRGSRHDFLDFYRRSLQWWERYLKPDSGKSN